MYKPVKNISLILGSAVFLTFTSVAGVNPRSSWTAQPPVEIPSSSGKFDFLRIDAQHHRLLASHEQSGTADYVDLQTNKLLERVQVGGVVDHAIDSEATRYYLSVQEPARVAILDAASLKEVNSIKTPGPTDAILFDPKNRLVYVTHDDGNNVWVIDPVPGTIIASVEIPGAPESVASEVDVLLL